jgi:hypothetical protein
MLIEDSNEYKSKVISSLLSFEDILYRLVKFAFICQEKFTYIGNEMQDDNNLEILMKILDEPAQCRCLVEQTSDNESQLSSESIS